MRDADQGAKVSKIAAKDSPIILTYPYSYLPTCIHRTIHLVVRGIREADQGAKASEIAAKDSPTVLTYPYFYLTIYLLVYIRRYI